MSAVLLTVFFIPAAMSLGLLLLSLTAERPGNLGVRDGRLAACPNSPNCVSTQTEDREHWIAPLTIASNAVPPIETLVEIVRAMPRATIVEQTADYLRVEFRSRIFRFCDDVEFFVDTASNRIHFRSASRVGHSDLGVNRDRMELIRQKFLETAPSSISVMPQAALRGISKSKVLAGIR